MSHALSCVLSVKVPVLQGLHNDAHNMHPCRNKQWGVLANSPQPGNANAEVTFDYHSTAKVTIAFAFPGLRAVC